MDLSPTIVPRSDQLNADDFMSGPQTLTITGIQKIDSSQQPIHIETLEYPGRPYKPCLSMRRILVAGWGKDGSVYIGRKLTLYCDPDVTFGREKVGGIRISHMSHLPERLKVKLTKTQGKRADYFVEPLVMVTAEQVQKATTQDELRSMWNNADEQTRALIQQRAQELQEQQ